MNCVKSVLFLLAVLLLPIFQIHAEDSYYDQIAEAASFIQSQWGETPEVGIILGTGLGGLAEEIQADKTIPYSEIPHFPVSTVESHSGKLLLGKLEGKKVVAMSGRFHLYEGYTAKQVAFPVYVMKLLGVKTLIVSNAAGGLNPQFERGDVMLIEDHINLLGANPLIGPNDERLGVRFPDMLEPYNHELIALAESAALENGMKTQKGVYVSLAGPNFETRAEYRYLRTIGGDAVGMSTVPEVIAAVHAGIKVLGISIITDMCKPDSLEPVSLDIVIDAARNAEAKMVVLVTAFLNKLPGGTE